MKYDAGCVVTVNIVADFALKEVVAGCAAINYLMI